MTTIADIRSIINAKDGTIEGDAVELSDDSIEIAIDNAETYAVLQLAQDLEAQEAGFQ